MLNMETRQAVRSQQLGLTLLLILVNCPDIAFGSLSTSTQFVHECTPPNFVNCGSNPYVFYIDPNNGQDANDGLSMDSSIRSLAHGLSLAASDVSSAFEFHLSSGYYGGFDLSPYSSSLANYPERDSSESWVQFISSSDNVNSSVNDNAAVFSHIYLNDLFNARIAFRGIHINATSPGQSGDNNAVNLLETDHVRIHNCYIAPQNMNIWASQSSKPQGINTRIARNVIVSETTILGGRYGVVFGLSSNHLRLIHSNIGYQFADSVRVSSASDVIIYDNHIHHVDDYQNSGEHLDGIQLFASGPAGAFPQPCRILIEKNRFTNMSGQMIFIQSNYVDKIGYIANVTISDNILGPKSAVSSAIPIQLQRVMGFVMERNTVFGKVLVRDGSRGHIQNNIFGYLSIASGSAILPGSNFNVVGTLTVDSTATADLGSNTMESIISFANLGNFDFAPTTQSACCGGWDGLHAGAVPCRVCEWASQPYYPNSPVALFASHPLRVSAGSNATFHPEASVACDPTSILQSAMWMISDGRTFTSSVHNGVIHSITVPFPDPGTYAITLTVVDALGAENSHTQFIVVETSEEGLLAWYPLQTTLLGDNSPLQNAPAIWKTISDGNLGIPNVILGTAGPCVGNSNASVHMDGTVGIVVPKDVRNSINNLAGVTGGIWAKVDKQRAQLFYKHVTLGIRVDYGKVLCAAGTANSKKFYETNTAYSNILGEWHHYAVTFDGLYVRCYVDGIEIASKASAQTDTVRIGNWDMTVGYHSFKSDRHLEGNLKGFRLYNKALTQPDIFDWFQDESAHC